MKLKLVKNKRKRSTDDLSRYEKDYLKDIR